MEFFGDRGAADLIAAFEHQRLESGLGQIEGRDQPVVAAADDDDVAFRRLLSVIGLCQLPSLSFRISSAASLPARP